MLLEHTQIVFPFTLSSLDKLLLILQKAFWVKVVAFKQAGAKTV